MNTVDTTTQMLDIQELRNTLARLRDIDTQRSMKLLINKVIQRYIENCVLSLDTLFTIKTVSLSRDFFIFSLNDAILISTSCNTLTIENNTASTTKTKILFDDINSIEVLKEYRPTLIINNFIDIELYIHKITRGKK